MIVPPDTVPPDTALPGPDRAARRPRRDPRAERDRRRLADGPTGLPRWTLATVADRAAGRRPRRDPRVEIAGAVVPAARLRLDRTSGGAARGVVISAPPPATEPAAPPREAAAAAIVTVEAPTHLVLVVAETPAAPSPLDRQSLGAARILAEAGGAVAVLGDGEGWGAAGADRLVATAGAADPARRAAGADPARRAAEVAAVVRALAPRHVIFAETPAGGDLARRTAALLDEPLFAGAESVTARLATRPARGGRMEQRGAPPRLLSLLADVVAPYSGPPREARVLPAEPAPVGAEGEIGARIVPGDPASVALSEAEFVLSAGNGLTDFAAFFALAERLGAAPAGSRVVCDAGLMPRERQVGASGSVIGARCYFALGIAGAPQHLQGITRCEHVIAVNTDLHAAMVERAELAIIADAQAVMPALLRALPSAPPVRSGTGSDRPAARLAGGPAAAVLLSAGRHRVSGRAAPVRTEAQATALALALGMAPVGVHAGPDAAAVADHFGHGLGEIRHGAVADGDDPVPALAAALAGFDLVLAGRRGEGGEDTGLVPYRVAAALGLPIAADAVAIRPGGEPGTIEVEQFLPRGYRRFATVRLPAVVTIHPAAPPPRPFAFGPARRGRLVAAPQGGAGAIAADRVSYEERPWRRRPRIVGGTAGGSAADRLRAATEVQGGGKVMLNPDPEAAAAEILAHLGRLGLLRG